MKYSPAFKESFGLHCCWLGIILCLLYCISLFARNILFLLALAGAAFCVFAFFVQRLKRHELARALWKFVEKQDQRSKNLELLDEAHIMLRACEQEGITYRNNRLLFRCHIQGTSFETDWVDTANTERILLAVESLNRLFRGEYNRRLKMMDVFRRLAEQVSK